MSDKSKHDETKNGTVNRRCVLLGGTTLAAATAVNASAPMRVAQAQQPAPASSGRGPNILVIFGDDIGQTNISAYSFGLMGYRTPNIDRIAREGLMFTDNGARVARQVDRPSSPAKRAAHRLVQGRDPWRDDRHSSKEATLAELLKPLGYATGQFGKIISAIATSSCRPCMASTSFWQSLSPQRGGGAGAAHLSARSAFPGNARATRRAALQGNQY